MNHKQTLVWDLSAINHLCDDAEYSALIVGITAGLRTLITSTNLEEIARTPELERKNRLMDVCQWLLYSGECIFPPHEILRRMIQQYEKTGRLDWMTVPVRFREAEFEIVGRVVTHDQELIREHGSHLDELDDEFAGVYADARPHFDKLFAGGEKRPANLHELLQHLKITPGGAFWNQGIGLHRKVTEKELDEAAIQKFIELCPSFHAILLALCMAQYERCVRPLQHSKSYRAGRLDMYSAGYLPYCDVFVTADERQYNALKEIAEVGMLTAEVILYQDFRQRLLPRFAVA